MTTPAVKMMMVYVTVPSKEIAMTIARTTVSEALIACANVIPGVTSVYQWKGKIEEDQEHVLIMKTVASNIDKLSQRIHALHPAETPCFVAISMDRVSSDFGEWIINSTGMTSHEQRLT